MAEQEANECRKQAAAEMAQAVQQAKADIERAMQELKEVKEQAAEVLIVFTVIMELTVMNLLTFVVAFSRILVNCSMSSKVISLRLVLAPVCG